MFRRLFAVCAAVLVLLGGFTALTHADVLQCPYPATGFQVRVLPVFGEAIGYVCNYPMEANKAHLHAEYGGFTVGGNVNGPIGGGANGGSTVGIGLVMWSQSWRCPNEAYIAAPPNGVGKWRDTLDWTGVKCPAVELSPFGKLIGAPWPPTDPNMIVVVNQIQPPGAPDPSAAPPHDPEAPPQVAEGAPNAPQIPLPLPGPGA